jgi:hypothetical protein
MSEIEGATDGKNYIGECVSAELFNIMKHHEPFNEKRYIKNLLNLPKEPFEKWQIAASPP